jgi:hypothetical protein
MMGGLRSFRNGGRGLQAVRLVGADGRRRSLQRPPGRLTHEPHGKQPNQRRVVGGHVIVACATHQPLTTSGAVPPNSEADTLYAIDSPP